MEAIPLHPQIVHIPIALAVLMPLVTIGLLLAWIRGWFPRKTWIIAMLLQIVLVGGAFASLRTGEADEERGEERVGKALVHEHEEAGEAFFFASIGVLVAIGAAQFVKNEKAARIVAGVAVLGTLMICVAAFRVGSLGGRIVHVAPPAGEADQAPGR